MQLSCPVELVLHTDIIVFKFGVKTNMGFPQKMQLVVSSNCLASKPMLNILVEEVREDLLKKECLLSGIAQISSPPPPTSPQFGQLGPLFSDVKNDVLRV